MQNQIRFQIRTTRFGSVGEPPSAAVAIAAGPHGGWSKGAVAAHLPRACGPHGGWIAAAGPHGGW